MNKLKSYLKNQLEMYCFLSKPKPIVPCKPENIYIEITNKCNLYCKMCARKKMIRVQGTMALSDYKFIVDKLQSENWIVPITLCGMGEPLLVKDLETMIKYAIEKGFNVSLISNSTLLTDAKIKMLIHSGLNRFQTMFDSIDKESYETIRYGADMEKTQKRLIELIQQNEEAGHSIYIVLGSIKTSLTKKIKETEKFWKRFPIDNFWISPLYTMHEESGMYEEAKDVKEIPRGICWDGFHSISISWDGHCQLCATDCDYRWVTGNVFKDKMDDIWNGKKAQEFRKALIGWDLDFFIKNNHRCDKCNVPYLRGLNIKSRREMMPLLISKKIGMFNNE